jgi:hypothetical protein
VPPLHAAIANNTKQSGAANSFEITFRIRALLCEFKRREKQ